MPKVRQAIAHAIPFDQIIQNGYFGQASPVEGRRAQQLSGLHQSATQSSTTILRRRRRLLAEAGYPEGKGLEAFGDAFQLSYVSEKESTLGPIVNIIQSIAAQCRHSRQR